ncbi:BTAD domain-containing putative transcriptional regulator [Streptomyces sp. NPDC058459]|uniref:BTAD domain-containing putative transcriptional regulator n=1 Tax=Streptomyces sp. NPDC058459 TaxID=3346508 RepID=UPI0036556DC9
MSARSASAPISLHQDDLTFPPRQEAVIRAFGKLTIQFSGQPLEIGPPRRRAVLALLVMRAGTVVSIPTILESLWGADLPGHAVTTLQSYVSRLRKLIAHRPLADGSELTLRYRSHGYVLDIAPENIDVVRFEQLVTRGLAAERRGDRARAFALLSASLQEWIAPPFEDLSEYDFAHQEAQRLSQLRLSAVEGRAEAALRLGRSGEILHDLEVEAAHHPARERLVALLMQAQYRDGRQADALRIFDHTRRYLSTELGVDVGPELRRTHEEILRQAPSLSPAEVAAPAVPAKAAETVASAPALRQMPFIGRQQELEVLRAAVDRACDGRGGVVSVLGESGSGKTALLREFRRRCAEREIDVLTVNCPKADALPKHWPWKQVLRVAAERWPHTIDALPAEVRATLVAMLPGWQGVPERTPRAQHPIGDFPVQEAVAQVLLALAGRPLVLVIEDLHWADVASLRLLRLLASQLADSRLLLVATSRTFRASADLDMRALLVAIRELPVSDEIILGGLDAEESRELARAEGQHLTDALADALHRRTVGNPYFLLALLKQLTPDTSAAAVESLLPEALEEVVLERLALLPGPVNDVLRTCTVLGADCTEPVLRRVVGGGDDCGRPAIQQAIRGGLLTPVSGGPSLRLVHPLLRDTVHRNLTHGELGKLHLRAVIALLNGAQPFDVRDSIGAHTRAALRTAPPERVLRPLLDEVEKAVKLGLYDMGLAWLDLLAEILHTPAGDQRYAQAELDVQLRRLDLLNVIQETAPASRDALRDRVRQLGCYVGSPQDGVVLPSHLTEQLARGDLSNAEATVSFLRCLAQQENDPYLESVAHYGQGCVHYARGELAEAQAAMDDGLARADCGKAVGSGAITPWWLYLCTRLNKTVIQWLRGHRDEAWQDMAEIRRLQSRSGIPVIISPLTISLVNTYEAVLRVFEDDPGGAERHAIAAVEPTQRNRRFCWQWLIDAVLLWANARQGTARSADFAAARNSLAREELAGTRLIALGLALVSDAERVAGRPREAHAYLRRLRRLVAQTGEVVFLNALPAHLLPWRTLPHAA